MARKTQFVTCEKCGGMNEIDFGSKYCCYCGSALLSDTSVTTHTYKKIDVARIKENESKEKIRFEEIDLERARIRADEGRMSREIKIIAVVVVAFFILALIGIGIVTSEINKKEKQRDEAIAQGKISAGYYYDYEGENYKAVVKQLEERGFTNIVTVDLKDSGLKFWNDGKVKSVSIDGNDNFDKDDYFFPNAKIIIKYH